MFYALSWFAVFTLLALWSLAAWALHAVAVWAISSAGALPGSAAGVGAITWPDWLSPWVPAELLQATAHLVTVLRPLLDSALQAAPALADGLTVVAWVVWAIGGMLLLLLGAGLQWLIALWRRRRDGGSGPSAATLRAAG